MRLAGAMTATATRKPHLARAAYPELAAAGKGRRDEEKGDEGRNGGSRCHDQAALGIKSIETKAKR